MQVTFVAEMESSLAAQQGVVASSANLSYWALKRAIVQANAVLQKAVTLQNVSVVVENTSVTVTPAPEETSGSKYGFEATTAVWVVVAVGAAVLCGCVIVFLTCRYWKGPQRPQAHPHMPIHPESILAEGPHSNVELKEPEGIVPANPQVSGEGGGAPPPYGPSSATGGMYPRPSAMGSSNA